MVTLIICLLISCAIILKKEKDYYPDNHLLMTYLVILLFAVMAISIKVWGCGCLLCERLWVRRENGNNE